MPAFVPFKPAKPRHRRKRGKLAPVHTAPVLVSATYIDTELRVVLVFDQAVAFDDYDGTAIILDDPVFNFDHFFGTNGNTLLNPTTVQIGLIGMGNPVGEVVTLSATASAGIVAAEGGLPWNGATGLALPFP
jgi:hypothetical protein